MMLLISMAITWPTPLRWPHFGWFDLEFWWELAALITIMLLGPLAGDEGLGQAHSALAPWPHCSRTTPSG